MKVSNTGTLASVVREGDYLVFRSEKWGISVEYSPGSTPGAPVIGGFAAKNGRATFFDATEAAQLIQNYPLTAEEEMIIALDLGSKRQRPKSTVDIIADAIRVYADSGYQTTLDSSVWDGKLAAFHKQIVSPLTGIGYSRFVAKTYKRIPAMLPGFELFSVNMQNWVRVEWRKVESSK